MQGEVFNKLRFGSDTAEYEGVGVMSALGLIFGIYLAVEQVSTGILRAEHVGKCIFALAYLMLSELRQIR